MLLPRPPVPQRRFQKQRKRRCRQPLCRRPLRRKRRFRSRRPQEPDGYEVLINGKGVCGDWSQAVSLLLNTAGLHVIGCGSDAHEWNMIEPDGRWHEFDCLWDDGCNPANWSYCNLSYFDMSKISNHKLFYPLRYPPADRSMMTLKLLFR